MGLPEKPKDLFNKLKNELVAKTLPVFELSIP